VHSGKTKILIVALTLLLILTGVILISQNQASGPPTKLVMIVFNKGLTSPAYTHVIDCRYSDDDDVCARLERLSVADFHSRPEPGSGKDCIADNARPRVAFVRGLLKGYPLHVRFDTSSPCQRRRWNQLSYLWASR